MKLLAEQIYEINKKITNRLSMLSSGIRYVSFDDETDNNLIGVVMYMVEELDDNYISIQIFLKQ